jgi:hypothetical protein
MLHVRVVSPAARTESLILIVGAMVVGPEYNAARSGAAVPPVSRISESAITCRG